MPTENLNSGHCALKELNLSHSYFYTDIIPLKLKLKVGTLMYYSSFYFNFKCAGSRESEEQKENKA